MVRAVFLLLSAAVGVACTPEAVVVDPETGGSSGMSSSGGSSGKGGDTSGAGEPSAPECEPLESPRAGCADCLVEQCAAEVAACDGTDCLCGTWGDAVGQFNCLLACPTVKPEMDAVNTCAQQCDFGSLGRSEPKTRALFDCAVDAPNGGPPVCPECFGLPPQP
jgi:hypothetical protein